ncbi:MAG: CDP-6-deoxy-delta-3,4-glucoseen reductase [Burkholderiaceae bacterium]|nr:CDP-6-deoxy-delta-3,4-glucoseen reductase [Burkholderiaceae bacterium]
MTFTVSITPSGKTVEVDGDTHILEAALAQGVVLPYGCKNGACGSCKARIVEGTIVQDSHQGSALTAEEERRGYALLCRARAASDLTIQARVVAAVGEIPIRKLPCRIAALERMAPDVIVMKLQLPANERLQYLAGQYVDLILRDGTRRSYSMATAPGTADGIELHVRHLPGGKFTDTLFGTVAPEIKVRDILRLEGPLGTFFLREDSDKPILMVASGTGFAPIKAMMERIGARMEAGGFDRPVTLYWGGRRPRDLYHDAMCREWEATIPGFTYVPVVSDALPDDTWSGRTGFVHLAAMADLPDMSGLQVYACGTPAMVDASRRDFIAERGLPADEFYADAFTTAADIAAEPGDA